MSRYRVDPSFTNFYFTTSTIVDWICVFRERKYFDIIIDSLQYCQKQKGLFILGYVIMLNHIHLITINEEDTSLSDIMRDFKRFTSKKISEELKLDNRTLELTIFREASRKSKQSDYKIWQPDFHPKGIRSKEFFLQKLDYIHLNPVRKGFVSRPEDWLYSSARNYILDDHSVIKLDFDVLG